MTTSVLRTLCTAVLLGTLLAGATGCLRLTRDPLVSDLTARQEHACRTAVRDELDERGVSLDRVRLVSYQSRFTNSRGVSNRVTGYKAWVFPQQGPGALVIELSESCQVKRAWAYGSR